MVPRWHLSRRATRHGDFFRGIVDFAFRSLDSTEIEEPEDPILWTVNINYSPES